MFRHHSWGKYPYHAGQATIIVHSRRYVLRICFSFPFFVMATFIQRLQLQGLQMLFFQQGEHQTSYVYQVPPRRLNMLICSSSILMARSIFAYIVDIQRYVAKLITPMHMNMLKVQPETLDHFQRTPGIDGTPVYQRCWDDPEGLAILMDFASYTLRNFINFDNQIGEIEWYHIMFGIASQLAAAHGQGQIHKDLKPSNSIPSSHACTNHSF